METIKCGDTEWMRFNFDLDMFPDGTPIPELRSVKEVEDAIENKLPGYAYPDFNPELGKTLGKLYTWEVVFGAKQLIPSGWKIPALSDLDQMSESLGLKPLNRDSSLLKSDSAFSGSDGKLMLKGFHPQPSGFIMDSGFQRVGSAAYLWTSPEKENMAAIWSVATNGERQFVNMPGMVAGLFSLRLIRSA